MIPQVEGYERLALLMREYPQLAVFRRFGSLNLQDLLFLQAELSHLEDELNSLIAVDHQTADGALLSQYWLALSEERPTSHGGGHHFGTSSNKTSRVQCVTPNRISHMLTLADETLEQQAKILALQPPSRKDLGLLTVWLRHFRGGNDFLRGVESTVWEPVNRHDLIAVRPRPESDKKFATDFLISRFAPIFGRRNLEGDENVVGLINYSARGLTLFMEVVTAVISSALLMASVVVLYYFVLPAGIRLGIIGVFAMVFSLGLAVFAGADRNEIFGATAACIAVQIVFVGTN